MNSDALISENIIYLNESSTGGGICCYYGDAEICRNKIIQNTGSHGGGIAIGGNSILIANNVIERNSASAGGGGIAIQYAHPEITGNIIKSNGGCDAGGGMFLDMASTARIVNCTIVNNTSNYSGGGMCCQNSNPDVTNSIFWENSSPLGKETDLRNVSGPSILNISHSVVEGGLASVSTFYGPSYIIPGPSLMKSDPLFTNSAEDDYHLSWLSPCRGTGDNNAVNEQYDFEDDPRITGSNVDMGADEYYPHLYHGGEVGPGRTVVFKAIGIPGAGSTLCHGPGLRNPPLPTPYGDLHLRWPLTFHNNGTFPASGYNEKAYLLPTGLHYGRKLHYQMLTAGKFRNVMTLVVE